MPTILEKIPKGNATGSMIFHPMQVLQNLFAQCKFPKLSLPTMQVGQLAVAGWLG